MQIFIKADCGQDSYVIPIDDILRIVPSSSQKNRSVIYTRSNERHYYNTNSPEELFDKINLAQSPALCNTTEKYK